MALFDMNVGLSAGMAKSLNNLQTVNRMASDSLGRLESGQRFNHAADAPSAVVKAGNLVGNITANQGAIDRNNGYIGDIEGIMSSQDSILGVLNGLKKTLTELSTASEGQAAIAEKFAASVGTIDTIAKSVAFNGAALGTGSDYSTSIVVNAGGGVSGSTGGSYTLEIDDLTVASLGISTSVGTTASAAAAELALVNTAIETVMTASAKVGAGKDVLSMNNSVMTSALTGWSQSYTNLVAVNDAAESSILSSLQNRQSAIQASMGYQAQFAARASSISFMA